jgi:RNA polymerase sigma-70 factor (ECF subfamily)
MRSSRLRGSSHAPVSYGARDDLDGFGGRAYSGWIVRQRDPLAHAPDLIRRVYSYVAYRLGDGPDAEDVTSDVFERALRYRDSYDPSRGEPLGWLLGIARRCVDDAFREPVRTSGETPDTMSAENVEAEAVERLAVAAAVSRLDPRAQDLIALRYGADLTARQIASMLGIKTNAVEVALHRTLARLRPDLERDLESRPEPQAEASRPAPEASVSPSGK